MYAILIVIVSKHADQWMMVGNGEVYKEEGVLWHWIVCHSSTTSISHSVIQSNRRTLQRANPTTQLFTQQGHLALQTNHLNTFKSDQQTVIPPFPPTSSQPTNHSSVQTQQHHNSSRPRNNVQILRPHPPLRPHQDRLRRLLSLGRSSATRMRRRRNLGDGQDGS